MCNTIKEAIMNKLKRTSGDVSHEGDPAIKPRKPSGDRSPYRGVTFTEEGLVPMFDQPVAIVDTVRRVCSTCDKDITEGYVHVKNPYIHGKIAGHYCDLLCLSSAINPMSRASFTLRAGALYAPYDPEVPNYTDDPELQSNGYPEGCVATFRVNGTLDITYFGDRVFFFSEPKKEPHCSNCGSVVTDAYLSVTGIMVPEHIKLVKNYCNHDCLTTAKDDWFLENGVCSLHFGPAVYTVHKGPMYTRVGKVVTMAEEFSDSLQLS